MADPIEPDRPALLVDTIHQPRRETVAECLARWTALDSDAQHRCYLVVEGREPGARKTLNGQEIERLARSWRLAA